MKKFIVNTIAVAFLFGTAAFGNGNGNGGDTICTLENATLPVP